MFVAPMPRDKHSIDAIRPVNEWAERWLHGEKNPSKAHAYISGFNQGQWASGQWHEEEYEYDLGRRRWRGLALFTSGLLIGAGLALVIISYG